MTLPLEGGVAPDASGLAAATEATGVVDGAAVTPAAIPGSSPPAGAPIERSSCEQGDDERRDRHDEPGCEPQPTPLAGPRRDRPMVCTLAPWCRRERQQRATDEVGRRSARPP